MTEATPQQYGNHYARRLLLDSAVLLAFGTGVLYFFGMMYQRSYFLFFGLSPTLVDVTRGQSLPQGVVLTSFVVLLTAVTLVALYRSPNPLGHTPGNIALTWPLISLLFVIVLWLDPELEKFSGFRRGIVQLAAGMILVLVLTALVSRLFPEYPSLMRRYGLVTLSVMLGIYFAAGLSLAISSGRAAAKSTQEGTIGRGIILQLIPDSPMQRMIDGKRLMLVVSSADRYYVVEQADPHTKNPPVYVIEKEQVAGAVLFYVGSD